MTLLLSESDVLELLSMKDAVDAVDGYFSQAKGAAEAVNSPRTRSHAAGPTTLNVMHASLPYLKRAGSKLYLSTGKGVVFVFLLFDLSSGALLAVMGADHLGRYRTGAASAVATKHLAGLKSFELGIAGSGGQALTQVSSMVEVASVDGVKVWSPRAASRAAFAQRVSRELGLDCRACDSLKEAFDAEVATTITSGAAPFVSRDAIEAVVHLNACGSNRADHAELSPEAVSSFSTVCVDDLAQARVEAGDLVLAAKAGLFRWEDAVELNDAVRSDVARRGGAGGGRGGRSLFKSNGVAAEDVALGSVVYEMAMRSGGYGREFDFRAPDKA